MSTRPQEDSFLSKSLSGDEDEPQKFSEDFFSTPPENLQQERKKKIMSFFPSFLMPARLLLSSVLALLVKKGDSAVHMIFTPSFTSFPTSNIYD